MRTVNSAVLLLIVALLFLSLPSFHSSVAAQKDQPPKPAAAAMLTRTTMRHESHRLSYGGTVTIMGPPTGSITVEGWPRSEVDVSAEIKLNGPSPADLDRLAAVNTFAVDADTNHIRILTTGTHDKKFLKQVAKNFPKYLVGLPWTIDYHIKVPAMTGLEIDAGNGPLAVRGVEGHIRLNALQSEADLSLNGGSVSAIIQSGNVRVTIPSRSWRGLGASISLASGNLDLLLQPGFSGDIDATVLRAGEVKNTYPNLEPRERNSITPRSIRARAGSGGGRLSFTVGDGIIQIRPLVADQKN